MKRLPCFFLGVSPHKPRARSIFPQAALRGCCLLRRRGIRRMGRKSSYVPDLETSGRMGQWLEPYPPPPPPPQEWVPWLMPLMALVLSFAFAFTMFVNDCPSSKDHDATDCVFYPSLGRFSFEPFFVNPLLGPTAET